MPAPSGLNSLLRTGYQVGSTDAEAAYLPALSSTLAPAYDNTYATLTQVQGAIKKATITFGGSSQLNIAQALANAVTSSGSKGQLALPLLVFPKRRILLRAVSPNLIAAYTAAWTPTTPVLGIGSVAVAASASSLTTTTQDIIASMAQTITNQTSPFQVNFVSPLLTDSTGGTVGTTLAAITAGTTYAQADAVATKNALASLNAQINAIAGGANGLQKAYYYDGHATPLTMYLNFACNSDPTTGKTITYTGTIDIHWEDLGNF